MPSQNLSFILLCNSSFATAPSRLGGGNPLTSPFVVAFLKHFVFDKELDTAAIDYSRNVEKIREDLTGKRGKTPHALYTAELLSHALTRSLAETTFKIPGGHGAALTKLLYDLDREVFRKNDPAVFHLLSLHSRSALDDAAKLANESYRAAGRFHPWIVYSIAKRFEAKGDTETSAKYFHLLVDTHPASRNKAIRSTRVRLSRAIMRSSGISRRLATTSRERSITRCRWVETRRVCDGKSTS